jgi:hypothetical protein
MKLVYLKVIFIILLIFLLLLLVNRKQIESFINYKNHNLTGLWRCNFLYNGNITFKQNDSIVKGYYKTEKEEIIGIISKNTIKMYIVDKKIKLDGVLIKDKNTGLITKIILSNSLTFNKVIRPTPISNVLKKLETPNLSGKWLDSNMRSDIIVIEQFTHIIHGYYRDIEFGTGEIVNNNVIFNYNFLNNTNEFNDSQEKKIIGSIVLKNNIAVKINWQNGTSWILQRR